MIAQASEEVIELRVDDIAQLFHTLDPFPFRERDLDKEAEEYIVGWARELSARQAIRIRVHHPGTDAQAKAASELRDAFAHYFADRASAIQGDINELFRVGRWSLAIGLVILITCLLVAHFVVGALFANPLRRLLEESLLILGWVANWRPLEIFLYDWWPLVRRRDLYRRLSKAVIETLPHSAVQSEAGPTERPAETNSAATKG
ncbi:hypothetical protein [Bradyrhizobium guangdongense]|uniref:hypothetical protein n=1 Tax=Bradyrhizobium guangdongense TaxID=1325090 RepID=UPI001643580C|nr:hypothetical protein [Bradyrhizobium guangdongense]